MPTVIFENIPVSVAALAKVGSGFQQSLQLIRIAQIADHYQLPF
jgi:hypothetical protein